MYSKTKHLTSAMLMHNYRAMLLRKPLYGKLFFSTGLFNIYINKNSMGLPILLQPSSRNIHKTKRQILNSILKSEISPFLNEKELHLLRPLFNSSKHYKIFYKFVLNYDVAADIVDKILPHIEKTKDIIVEANPGLGFITLCLINSDIPKVIILDKSEIRSISVNQLIKHWQKKLRLVKVNLFKFPGLQITNLIENSVKSNSCTKIIGIITNNTFLINLMYTYIVNELWDIMHYLEFYLVVSSLVWNTIITCSSSDSRYFYHSLFNFMFEFEELAKYSSDAFFPVASNDKKSLTLVKITANLELIKRITKNDLKSFVFFLDILSRNRQTFIIPTLEKFVPDCGPYLVSRGVSMSNIIRDFSSCDNVFLFNVFKNCKGYELFKTLNVTSYESVAQEIEKVD